jgi:trans-aconitate 2-methyltransferase
VQMPHRGGRRPYLEALHAVARDGPWRAHLADLTRSSVRPGPSDYYRWLSPHAGSVDIWSTEYLHVLTGEDPVFAWTQSAAQQAFLGRLGAAAFAEAYRRRLREAYPPGPGGKTLFPFLRLFIVAVGRK